jgi:hypothetical protein
MYSRRCFLIKQEKVGTHGQGKKETQGNALAGEAHQKGGKSVRAL